MKLSEIYAVANELAPKRLSDTYCETYGAYDNSGVLVDCGEEITGVVFSLDLSSAAIDTALAQGANLILTHHPAIYGKIGDIRVDTPLGEKLVRCIRRGISVFSMHLNLDCAQGGVDESLRAGICKALGCPCAKNEVVMHTLTGGGYGRAYDVNDVALHDILPSVEKEFSTKRVLAYGDGDRRISRVASFCGAGADEGSIAFAKAQGADLFVSSDCKHHLIAQAIECGMAVMVLTHYASENYGFEKYYEKIRERITIPCVYHTDEYLL